MTISGPGLAWTSAIQGLENEVRGLEMARSTATAVGAQHLDLAAIRIDLAMAGAGGHDLHDAVAVEIGGGKKYFRIKPPAFVQPEQAAAAIQDADVAGIVVGVVPGMAVMRGPGAEDDLLPAVAVDVDGLYLEGRGAEQVLPFEPSRLQVVNGDARAASRKIRC